MTPENTEKLYQAFPMLYRGKDKSLQESSMSWGFECDDGWFDLIWKLSHAIEECARCAGLKPDSDRWPEAIQVKQKFGSLRVHLINQTDEMCALINSASDASMTICETCGAIAAQTVVINRWVQALCHQCHEIKAKLDYGSVFSNENC